MVDRLVNETVSRFGFPAPGALALVRELLSIITDDRTGGPEGFIERFRQAGLDDLVRSWFGGTDGRAITPSHIESALGASAIDMLARSSSLTRTAVTSALTFLVPKLIGRFTATGGTASSPLPSPVSASADRPVAGVQAAQERSLSAWSGWLPLAVAATVGLIALLWLRAYAADSVALSRARASAAASTVVDEDVPPVRSN